VIVPVAKRSGVGALPNLRHSRGRRRLERIGAILGNIFTVILKPRRVLGVNAIKFGPQLQGPLPRHHQPRRTIKSDRSGRSGMALFGRLARHGLSAHMGPSLRGAVGAVSRDALTEKRFLPMIAGAKGVSIFFHIAPSSGSG
jgi:hypothetical protein